jgi:cell division GTPase FtsZ
MNILMLSVGGGGGHILRSVKALFRRDLATVQKSDPRYAERLRRAVVTRFLDTNEFSVSDIPADERVIIGAQTTGRLGSRHDPDVARRALEESTAEVDALLRPYSVVILIGTGGKGTGAGTLWPIARMAREQRKLVIPIFVRPSFEWHEVEKRRYDHALTIPEQFDAAGIRLIEILNDRGYSSANPQPQQTVWERMNRPIARALRGLLYVLSDLSQVDPSDLSMLFAGPGRLRVGFAEIDPQPGADPTDDEVRQAVDMCWENPYSLFSKPVGTSLVCIHGQWSNVVDGRIKGGLAALATAGAGPATYNPLHAFAPAAPKPWGVTALFAEYTGNHPPLQIEWPDVRSVRQPLVPAAVAAAAHVADLPADAAAMSPGSNSVNGARSPWGPIEERPAPEPVASAAPAPRSFATFWEFALALNRNESSAVALAADGATCDIPLESGEIRKLLSTVWFRSAFRHLSPHWRNRLLDVLLSDVTVGNHMIRDGRRSVRLGQISSEALKRAATDVTMSDTVRADVQLLIAIETTWGSEALARITFAPVEAASASASGFGAFLQPFRNT